MISSFGRKTRRPWLAPILAAVTVAALTAAGFAIYGIASQAPAASEPRQASDAVASDGAIIVGTGTHVVDVWTDPICPACGMFEQLYGDTLDSLVDDGTITLRMHPVAFLDDASNGTNYSSRAANATYCVADSSRDAARRFTRQLFANQPAEGSAGLTDDQLTDLAAQSGADVSACITDLRFSSYVTAATKSLPSAPGTDRRGTPTVIVDGTFLTLTGDVEKDFDALG
jgi:protein-disulfide isomerase